MEKEAKMCEDAILTILQVAKAIKDGNADINYVDWLTDTCLDLNYVRLELQGMR